MCVPQHTNGGQRTFCGNGFSSSIMCVLSIELKLSSLAVGSITRWAILLALKIYFIIRFKIFKIYINLRSNFINLPEISRHETKNFPQYYLGPHSDSNTLKYMLLTIGKAGTFGVCMYVQSWASILCLSTCIPSLLLDLQDFKEFPPTLLSPYWPHALPKSIPLWK